MKQTESVSLSEESKGVVGDAVVFRHAAHNLATAISCGDSASAYSHLGEMMGKFERVVSEYAQLRYSRLKKGEKVEQAKPRGRRRNRQKWSDNAVKFLRENWDAMTPREIAKQLERKSGVKSVITKAYRLGLKCTGFRKMRNQETKIPVIQA